MSIQGPAMGAILAMHDRPAEGGRVFVDCIECGCREKIHVDVLDAVSDEQATRMFEKRGWSVRPTVCPSCQTRGGA